MSKEFKDMTFEELVKFGVEIELDAIVKGESLRSRVWQIMACATQWHNEQTRPIADAPRNGTRIMVFNSETKSWGFGAWKEGEQIDAPFTHWKPSPPNPKA